MKTIEFNSDHLPSVDEISNKLIYDDKDPRSISYVRKLSRPSIKWFRISCYVFIPIVFLFAVGVILKYSGVSAYVRIAIICALSLSYIFINAKRSLICIIKIYQRYAPESVRNKCRFEPSCSEYMILSINKYGMLKGFSRLKRCNTNGGGYDYP